MFAAFLPPELLRTRLSARVRPRFDALEALADKGAATRAALDARKAAGARAAAVTPHGESILLSSDPRSQRSP